jgi:hypothetical protein
MTDSHDLRVEVQGDYIIITLRGTKFNGHVNPPETCFRCSAGSARIDFLNSIK